MKVKLKLDFLNTEVIVGPPFSSAYRDIQAGAYLKVGLFINGVTPAETPTQSVLSLDDAYRLAREQLFSICNGAKRVIIRSWPTLEKRDSGWFLFCRLLPDDGTPELNAGN